MSTTDHSSWQEALKKELKTDNIERFLHRKLLEGGELSLLGTEAKSWAASHGEAPAMSYTFFKLDEIHTKTITELLAVGVWDFIVDPHLMGVSEADVQSKLSALGEVDARIWVMGSTLQSLSKGTPVINASSIVSRGGHGVHELAWLLDQVITWASQSTTPQIGVAVNCDREFFKTIAKVRALKAVVQAALKELKKESLFDSIKWIGRSSWRDFTAFDAASNILRNATGLSGAYISGVDVVESLPYDLLINSNATVRERAHRLALASQLVLQQESSLGEVADAASGSYALENLTRTLGEQAWTLMQDLQDSPDKLAQLLPLVDKHWLEIQRQVNVRKLVQTGVNDFPDAVEKVELRKRFEAHDHVRLGKGFESLRLTMQGLKTRPVIAIPVVGDYAALNARLSFTKNFFELLGLEVLEPGRGLELTDYLAWTQQTGSPIWAVVAADETHAQLNLVPGAKSRIYLAGKTPMEGVINMHAGMDVHAVLQGLLTWWSAQ